MEKLSKSVSQSTSLNVKTANGLLAKYDLLDICFEKLILLIAQRDKKTSFLLEQVYRGVKSIVENLHSCVGESREGAG